MAKNTLNHWLNLHLFFSLSLFKPIFQQKNVRIPKLKSSETNFQTSKESTIFFCQALNTIFEGFPPFSYLILRLSHSFSDNLSSLSPLPNGNERKRKNQIKNPFFHEETPPENECE